MSFQYTQDQRIQLGRIMQETYAFRTQERDHKFQRALANARKRRENARKDALAAELNIPPNAED